MKKFSYDTQEFDFITFFQKIFKIDNISLVHQIGIFDLLKRETDQSTDFHKLYYDNVADFLEVYERFIIENIKPIFSEQIVYQKIPTFRIQVPNNVGVGEWHKDKQYQHNQEEINFFLPFTRAFDTNTIWVESEEDKGDFKPIEAEFVMWNGCHLTHGNKINRTSKTRISVDFRVIPLSRWKIQGGESINTKVKFDIGGYYNLSN